MKTVKYTLHIRGLTTPPGTITLEAMEALLVPLRESAERSLRLVTEGASTRRGQKPQWIKDASNFVIHGFRKGSTQIDISAPVLGDISATMLDQQNMWLTSPSETDTALTVLAHAIHDASQNLADSDYLDRGLLESIRSFQPYFKQKKITMQISSGTLVEDVFELNEKLMGSVKKMITSTPLERAVVISGKFDSIEHSDRKFKLTFDQGGMIQGIASADSVDTELMRRFWGKKVTIKGTLHYKPSGKERLVEADTIEPYAAGDGVFQTVRTHQEPMAIINRAVALADVDDMGANFFGKWPGDESIDDLMKVLLDGKGM